MVESNSSCEAVDRVRISAWHDLRKTLPSIADVVREKGYFLASASLNNVTYCVVDFRSNYADYQELESFGKKTIELIHEIGDEREGYFVSNLIH